MSANQRIGVIDLGSNTARLVVYRTIPGYSFREEDEIREVVRLRQGMTGAGLSAEAMGRGFLTLRLFKRFCDSTQVSHIIATATSAVRDAANQALFLERVRREIGFDLRVLSGEEEAYYGVVGALSDVAIDQGVVVDIGGGSAQLSLVQDRQFAVGQSTQLGALALSERFVQSDPISAADYRAVQTEIERQLAAFTWLPSRASELVGLGGTIRNLARMDAMRQNYPLQTLHGFELTQTALEQIIEVLRKIPLAKRKQLPGLRSDRADIILPGAMVLRSVMEQLRTDVVTVAISGLREGLFLEQFWGHLTPPIISDARRFGVLNLARIYSYQKSHANHVRFLAGRIFDQLAPLHHYGAAQRELLDAAALLHDIGTVINYADHHQHSQTLIVTNGLPGFSPREIALIALLARYHRKGQPSVSDYQALVKPDDDLLLGRLAAILRLAEYFERGRNASVDDVIVTWTEETLRMTLVADEYPAVEIWQAERNAVELMESMFGRRMLLDSTAATEHHVNQAPSK